MSETKISVTNRKNQYANDCYSKKYGALENSYIYS